MPKIDFKETGELIRSALREDLGRGDITTRLTIAAEKKARAVIRAKQSGIFAGGPVAKIVFQTLDRSLRVSLRVREGERIRRGQNLIEIEGSARSILSAERTALNFLQHLCGIATQTGRVVRAVGKSKTRVLATRKTIPGLRSLQKYAVQVGGGLAHRQGLYDEVLLKENHLEVSGLTGKSLLQTIRRKAGRRWKVGAEARDIREAQSLIEGGADWILLDNMNPAPLRRAVLQLRSFSKKIGRKVELEASGNIGEKNAARYGSTGVDRISLGSLTHSVHALDLSLDFLR